MFFLYFNFSSFGIISNQQNRMSSKSSFVLCIYVALIMVSSAQLLSNAANQQIAGVAQTTQSAISNLQNRLIQTSARINNLRTTVNQQQILQTISNSPVFDSLQDIREKQAELLLGTWNVVGFDNVKITFEQDGKFTLNGCNIHGCTYDFIRNVFTTNGICISTKRACPIDNDSLILQRLASATRIYFRPGEQITFLNNSLVTVLVLKLDKK